MLKNNFTDQAFAAALPDAIIVLTETRHLAWWNPAAEKLFSLKAARPNVTHVTELLDKDLLENSTQATIEIPSPHQSDIKLSISLVPYENNYQVLIAKDITHVNHLEKMREDFVANVSHELRTPLTVIHGYIETLLDQNHDETRHWRAIFEQMQQQTLRMELLVEDLLLLSRLETDLPEAKKQQPVAIAEMLTAICTDARALSGDRQHDIRVETVAPFDLYGCYDELRSAFSNLIFNAVNYTPAHGKIIINWIVNDASACLEVKDSGIGIAAKHIPWLTQRFYRVDKSRSRAGGGSGLGLAIVKHVLLRHDGQLKIESTLGKGSTFQCLFPLQRVVGK